MSRVDCTNGEKRTEKNTNRQCGYAIDLMDKRRWKIWARANAGRSVWLTVYSDDLCANGSDRKANEGERWLSDPAIFLFLMPATLSVSRVAGDSFQRQIVMYHFR